MTIKGAVIAAAVLLVAASYVQASPAQVPFSASNNDQLAGQSVFSFSTTSRQQHDELLKYVDQLDLDVWSSKRGHLCGATPGSTLSPDWDPEAGCVAVRMLSSTKDDLLSQLGLQQPTTLIANLQATIQEQQTQRTQRRQQLQYLSFNQTWHDDYRSYDEISAFLSDLQETYPGYAEKIEIGKTHEGRSIFALKVGKGQVQDPSPPPPSPPDDGDNPDDDDAEADRKKGRKGKRGGGEKIGIVIAAEQHAREWISASTSLFFASELLRSALGNSAESSTLAEDLIDIPWSRKEAKLILNEFDLTFIPLANPDGYVYSWEQSRMWRKNRQPTKFPGICKGVDLNRNWGMHFESAFNPCSESFPGSKAFDTLETQAIAAYMNDTANNVRGFFDLHSYGQLFMYPYAFSCDEPVRDEEDLLELSLGAVRALRNVHKRSYTTGKMCAVFATQGGAAIDYAYASKVKWSFSIELRDGGTYGFLLPPDQIVASGQETGQALVYMLKFIAQKENH